MMEAIALARRVDTRSPSGRRKCLADTIGQEERLQRHMERIRKELRQWHGKADTSVASTIIRVPCGGVVNVVTGTQNKRMQKSARKTTKKRAK